MFPENIATNANFTRTEQYTVISGCKPCCDGACSGFLTVVSFGWEKSHVLSKNNGRCSELIFNDGLSKTFVGALPYWTGWVDEPALS